MAVIKYENIKLRDTTKSGKLRKDENGYYDVILGAMNTFNSRGEYYTMKGAEKIFTGSSTYHRLISQGKLFGEHGHPKPDGFTREQYMARLKQIREECTGTFFKDVTLDDTLWKRYPRMVSKGAVIIMGKVKPYGPFKETVEDGLSNPDINFAYSVRSFTDNYRVDGRTVKVMVECVTWDSVGAQGIPVAEKYCSPTLEAHSESVDVGILTGANEIIQTSNANGLESKEIGNYDELIMYASSMEEAKEVIDSGHVWRQW